MKQALVTVRYCISGDANRFRQEMEHAAAMIARTPGMVWKIWGLEAERDTGLSAYLFESTLAAKAFAAGPAIAGLKGRPNISDVAVDIAPVEQPLSVMTGASAALGFGVPKAA